MKRYFKFTLSLLVSSIFLLQGNYVYAEGNVTASVLKWLLENEVLLRVLLVTLIPILFKSAGFIFNLPLKAFQNDISILNKDDSLIPNVIMSSIPLFLIMITYESSLTFAINRTSLMIAIMITMSIYLVVLILIGEKMKDLNKKNNYINSNNKRVNKAVNKVVNTLQHSQTFVIFALVTVIFAILIFEDTHTVNIIGVLYTLIFALSISGALHTLYLVHNLKPYELKLKNKETEINKTIYILAETREFIIIKQEKKEKGPISISKSNIDQISPIINENTTKKQNKAECLGMVAIFLMLGGLVFYIAKPTEAQKITTDTNNNKVIEDNIIQDNKLEINYFDGRGEVIIKRKNVFSDSINNIFLELMEDNKLNGNK